MRYREILLHGAPSTPSYRCISTILRRVEQDEPIPLIFCCFCLHAPTHLPNISRCQCHSTTPCRTGNVTTPCQYHSHLDRSCIGARFVVGGSPERRTHFKSDNIDAQRFMGLAPSANQQAVPAARPKHDVDWLTDSTCTAVAAARLRATTATSATARAVELPLRAFHSRASLA